MKKTNILITFLYIIISAIPAFFGLTAISLALCAAALTFCFMRGGARLWGINAAFSELIFFFVLKGNPESFAFVSAVTLLLSLSFGVSLNKKLPFRMLLCIATVLCTTIFAGTLFYYMKTYSTSAYKLLFGTPMDALRAAAGPNLDILGPYLDALAAQLDLMLPSILIICSMLFSYAVFGIARTVGEHSGIFFDTLPHYYSLHADMYFSLIFSLLIVFSLFDSGSGIVLNAIAVISAVLAACGTSAFNRFLRMRGVKKAVRIIIYTVLLLGFLTGFAGTFIYFAFLSIGVFDSFAVRRIFKK